MSQVCSLCDSGFPYEKGHITRTYLALLGLGREENTLGNAEQLQNAGPLLKLFVFLMPV